MLPANLSVDAIGLAGFFLGMAAAYLAGSINFSILLFLLLGRTDPRKSFSGNAGVSNVYRQAGLPLAAMVLLLDVGRAAAVALLATRFWADSLVPWAGLALIMGNRMPCFHGFKGGKGVANYIGFCGVLLPLGTAVALVAYLLVFAFFRISFLGSFGLLSVLALFGLMHWWPDPLGMAAVVLTVGAIVWFHSANITGFMADRR